jgi:hypothetical protein
MYGILGILLFLIRKNISPAPTQIPTPIPATLDVIIKKLKRDNLVIKNEIARMQKESKWRNEVRSQGL